MLKFIERDRKSSRASKPVHSCLFPAEPGVKIDSAGHASHELKFDSVEVKYGIWTRPVREGSF